MDEADLAFAGIARQAELVREREVSARDLVQLYLRRIERLDPSLNAFRVVLAEQALTEAKQASARRRSGGERPLLGVPVAVKDNLDVAGERTLHGSGFGPIVRDDAEVVRRLREAGAIVIGKTQMPELAIFPWTESAAFGTTRNPWDPGRSAGGSSGGSGVAVAAGLVGAASATDGGGSIRIPAACNGLVGLKPQVEHVPFTPPDHWHGLSASGALTRSVADSALWLDVVGDGLNLREAAASDPGSLRIAVSYKPSYPARVHPRTRDAVGAVAAALGSLGHSVEEHDPDYGLMQPLFVPRWLRGIHDDAVDMPQPQRLERRTRRLSTLGSLISPDLVGRAREAARTRARAINRLFERYDALLTPVIPAPPDPIGRFEGRSALTTMLGAGQIVPFTAPWNVTGQPAASIPAPIDDRDVPLAAQLIGRPEDERTLVMLAAQLERELRWTERRPPVE